VAVAQLRAEDEAGRVSVPIERVEISHAARAGVVPDCSGCQIADKQFNLRPEDLMPGPGRTDGHQTESSLTGTFHPLAQAKAFAV
jgi:hypothetical protein